eukprot:899643-Amphidinium_carterae.2
MTQEDIEYGRQLAMEQHRQVTFAVNARLQQAAEDTDVNMDAPTVTIPPEEQRPRASSNSSIDSDSTIDREHFDSVERMMQSTCPRPNPQSLIHRDNANEPLQEFTGDARNDHSHCINTIHQYGDVQSDEVG